MPSVSAKQRRFMSIAEHNPVKLRGKKPDMSQSQLHDFASTSEKNLPIRKKAINHLYSQSMKGISK